MWPSNQRVTSSPSPRSGVAVSLDRTWAEGDQQASVRRRGRVVELVDDDDVERVGVEVLQPMSSSCGERLDGREYVARLTWALARNHQLAEAAVAEHISERLQALV